MFSRDGHPAKGRRGGHSGGPSTFACSGGAAMQGKSKQLTQQGEHLLMGLSGDAEYGNPADRDKAPVMRDLALDYISPQFVAKHYLNSVEENTDVIECSRLGEDF